MSTPDPCFSCSLKVLCQPSAGAAAPAGLAVSRRKVARRTALFRAGQPFNALFAIRSGSFKTSASAPNGREQITGFQIAGDLLGLDGIVEGRHSCDAVALEDSEVCAAPYAQLGVRARESPALQELLHRLMSREIVHEHRTMLLLGSMRAEERLAAFLLDLAARNAARGLSESQLVLRMTRQDMGSYLGLQFETVSRLFGRFAGEGLLEVKHRRIRVLDADGLRRVMQPGGAERAA